MLGGQERRNDKKAWKSRSEEKMVGFSSAFLFSARKREAFTRVSLFLSRKRESVTQNVTKGIDNPSRRKTQGAGIIKGWEDERDHKCIPDTLT